MTMARFRVPSLPSLAPLALGLALAIHPAAAQDFKRIAPKEMPPNPELRSLPAPASPVSPGGATVLLPALKGLVFTGRATQIQPGGLGTAGVDTSRVDLLDSPLFREVVGPYLGRPLTLDRLNEIVKLTVVFFREHDHPLVDVIVPEQDITGGTVQVLALEFTAGAVRTEGNRWFSDDLLLSGIRTRAGDRVLAGALLEDINLLNENPFRRVDLVYQRGAEPGQSDIVLRTEDRFPVRVYTGYENSGTASTGLGRAMAGFNWGNALGLGHMLNYQATGSSDVLPGRPSPHIDGRPGMPRYLAHSGSYVAPLPWRDRLSVFGAYAETVPALSDSFNMVGVSWQGGARYAMPLARLGEYRHELSLGGDFKRTNNNLDFGGTQIYGNHIDIAQGVIDYTGGLPDPWGSTGLSANLTLSPGGVTSGNTRRAFTGGGGRDVGRPRYLYGRVGVDRSVDLPKGFGLSARGQLQASTDPLQSSEQFGIGGATTVRGYSERAANGDRGWLLSGELLLPAFSVVGTLTDGKDAVDSLRPHAFLDAGHVSNRSELSGQSRAVTLTSTGVGFRYALPPYASVGFDYGVQLRQSASGTATRGSMAHLAITAGL